jgi:hypothetical protein
MVRVAAVQATPGDQSGFCRGEPSCAARRAAASYELSIAQAGRSAGTPSQEIECLINASGNL